jgi:hypothetical protein
VRFVVTQLEPVCRQVGSFVVSAHRGRNTVRLRPRVGGRRLAPGTYRVVARRGSVPLFGVRIVVANRRIVRRDLVAATPANPCAPVAAAGAIGPVVAPIGTAALAPAAVAPGKSAAGAPAPKAGVDGGKASPSAPKPQQPHRGQALGAEFSQSPGAGTDLARLLVLAAVGLSILLLAAAALPDGVVPAAGVGAALARRRIEIALAGAVTLLGAVVAYLVAAA